MRLRVLTFNVQNDEGDPRRTGLINRELRRLAPDLVALQEVRYPAQLVALLAGTGLIATHQEEVLERRPPEAYRFGGTVVATRWPHEVREAVESRPGDEWHWWTLTVSVAVPGRGGLLFVSPTTPWEPDAAPAREAQLRHVRSAGPPTVVAGDLNAGPEEAGVRYLKRLGFLDAWERAGTGPGHTWTVDNPLGAAAIERSTGQRDLRRRIDHILAAPDRGAGPGNGATGAGPGGFRVTSASLVGTEPVDGVWLSDHFGVVADLHLG
jgi:endonuclease/exonuclease/phosphatase family metal-dependent hydrolase